MAVTLWATADSRSTSTGMVKPGPNRDGRLAPRLAALTTAPGAGTPNPFSVPEIGRSRSSAIAASRRGASACAITVSPGLASDGMSPASRYPAGLVRATRAGCCTAPLAGDRGTLASHGRDRGQPTVDGEGRGMSVMRKLTIRRSSATLPGVPGHEPGDVVTEQPPLAYRAALRALISCVASTVRLLWRGRIHLPLGHVGMRLRFADGTSAGVYRETVADRGATRDPCVLAVEFRLRAVRGI